MRTAARFNKRFIRPGLGSSTFVILTPVRVGGEAGGTTTCPVFLEIVR